MNRHSNTQLNSMFGDTEKARCSCDFCDEMAGVTNRFSTLYEGIIDSRLMYESTACVAIPSLGQIVEGHVLVVPKRHFPAMAYANREEWEDSWSVIQQVGAAIQRRYDVIPLIFEHGSTKPGNSGIHHAHIHIMPNISGVLYELFQRFNANLTFDLQPHIYNRIESCGEYLFVASGQQKYLIDIPPHESSQIMRRLIASVLGHQPQDWRYSCIEESLLLTLQSVLVTE